MSNLSLLLVELAVILAAAKIAGHMALKLGQPGILGELLAGVALGTTSRYLLSGELQEILTASTEMGSHLSILGEIGILLLLFRVGLESQTRDLLGVGSTSILVAILGLAIPLALGSAVCSLFANTFVTTGEPWQMHVFVGATMAATSVGVTARVLSDMGRIHTRESRIILGAAVIDDILGLLLLAVVTGVIASSASGTTADLMQIVLSVGSSSVAFILVGTIAGAWIARRYLRLLKRIEGSASHTAGLISFCLLFAAAAELAGLAALVGAFLAGLVIDDEPVNPSDCEDGSGELAGRGDRELLPFTSILAPIFFVVMGMQVQVDQIFRAPMALYILAISMAAFVGKMLVGVVVPGPLASKGFVGAGMVPRGEVGLIFAAVGRSVGAIGEETFSALVFMVIVTTLVSPALLKFFESGVVDSRATT